MLKRNVPNSPRLLELKKERRKAIFGKIFLIFATFLVIFASLAYVSRLEQLNIREIRITGNKVVEGEVIKEIVEEKIAGYYLWLVPKTNILLYPKNNIKTELQEKFRRLKNINLSVASNKVLGVTVTEREGLFIWCGDQLPEASTENKCYFVDENGYIFAEAPYFSGEVYFKFYAPIDGTSDDPTGSYLLNGNFEKIILFKNALETMGLKPVALYAKDNNEIKLYLSKGKSLSMGPEIIFTIDADLENLAENLETALSTEPLLSNFKNKYSSLEYIDLRYGNKVYYRFR